MVPYLTRMNSEMLKHTEAELWRGMQSAGCYRLHFEQYTVCVKRRDEKSVNIALRYITC